MNTNSNFSPHDLLPTVEPFNELPEEDYFYQNVAKHLIKDTVRVQMNGLGIDLDEVENLEEVLNKQLEETKKTLASNKYVKQYLKQNYSAQIEKYKEEQRSKMKTYKDFIKPFKYNDMIHRSYFMNEYASQQGIAPPNKFLDIGPPKWEAKTVKKLSSTRPLLSKLLNNQLPLDHPIIKKAMTTLAKDKATIYNKSYHNKIASPNVDYPEFNPGSSKQKIEFFEMLEVESEITSKKTGLPSWDKDQVERVHKETQDPILKEFTQCLINHSTAAIVRNNFIEAFYKYTVNGRVYGQYKLLGAKSGRYTSSNPNMLNQPSTGTIFAKPIKKCFKASPGFLIATADYSALEDRVIASLSKDKNKCAIFTDGVDGHSLGAITYFPEACSKEMTLTGDTIKDAKEFKKLVDTGNKTLKTLRQDGKPVTFGLSLTYKRLHVAIHVENHTYAGNSRFRDNQQVS